MTFQEIQELMQNFDQSGIHSLTIEDKDFKLVLSKPEAAAPVYAPPAVQPTVSAPEKEAVSAPSASPSSPSVPSPKTAAQSKLVKAPLVGVFYRASAPGEQPYARVGDTIKAGDIVCLIEAMKIINEIKAPVNGVISAIHAEDGALVSYHDVLMEIEER